MFNRLRNLFSSSPRAHETSSPSGSIPLPPPRVVIRRALCQDEPAAVQASLTEDCPSSNLDPPSTIANLRPLPTLDVSLQSPQSSHFLSTPPNTVAQFVPQNQDSSTNITPQPAVVDNPPLQSSHFLSTPPNTVAQFNSQNVGIGSTNITPKPAFVNESPLEHPQSSHFLTSPPDDIAQFAPQNPGVTSTNITPKPAVVNNSGTTSRFTRRRFSSPLRKLTQSIFKKTPTSTNKQPASAAGSSLATPSVIVDFDDQGRELPPWTPDIHSSSSNFFAADSPVFLAPMPTKRSRPSDAEDLESQRTPKRIKSESQRDQSASPVTSLHRSPSSQRSCGNAATVYSPDYTRTPAPPKRNRKRARVEDGEDDDVDYSASSSSDSDATQCNSVAKTDSPGKKATIDKPLSPPTTHSTTSPSRRVKRPRRARSDSLYIDEAASDEGEFEVPEAHERNQLGIYLTREKARRLANAVQVPENSNMCTEERDLYSELALRGIKPVMSYDWARDFSTLPESIFSVENTSKEEEDKLTLKADKGTDFAAKRAFQELLKIGGCVRDCKILTVQPETVIERAIRKYIRWAITDAGLKTTPETIPVHTIYTQKPGESVLSAVSRLGKRLERLAQRHQKVYGRRVDTYWPSLIGFLTCGPILTIMTLDSNPRSEVWTKDRGDGEDGEVRAKYLGQFDMSEIDSDVWNSLAVAIAVIQMRQSMGRLAHAYEGPLFPRFRGQSDDSDDEDL